MQSMDPMSHHSCGATKNCKCNLPKKIQELETGNYLIQFPIEVNYFEYPFKNLGLEIKTS